MATPSKSHAQRLVELATGRDLAELLRELYVERRWTDEEIGKHLNMSRMTVVNWRAQFGIDRSQRTTVLDSETVA